LNLSWKVNSSTENQGQTFNWKYAIVTLEFSMGVLMIVKFRHEASVSPKLLGFLNTLACRSLLQLNESVTAELRMQLKEYELESNIWRSLGDAEYCLHKKI